MKFARTLAIAAVTAVVSLGASPVAHADKPGSEPCAKQEQQVTKAQEALEHVTAVFAHQGRAAPGGAGRGHHPGGAGPAAGQARQGACTEAAHPEGEEGPAAAAGEGRGAACRLRSSARGLTGGSTESAFVRRAPFPFGWGARCLDPFACNANVF